MDGCGRVQRITRPLRQALDSLKRDVASSFRICSRDFGLLGAELVDALASMHERHMTTQLALAHECAARVRAQAKITELQGNIRVFCRVRPLLMSESSNSESALDKRVHVESHQDVQVFSPVDGSLYKSFSFARVFHEESTQQQVFKEVAPLVSSAVDGRHACIFAYGQTGTGKTHTMKGPDEASHHQQGVYPRATRLIFESIQEQTRIYDFSISLQMVEIYNEEIYDLLGTPVETAKPSVFSTPAPHHQSGSGVGSPLPQVEIRHGELGVYLKNITSVPVEAEQDVFSAIDRGNANRSVYATNRNESINRSHSVILMDITRTSKVNGQVHHGRMVFVDLAGSERVSKTETTGQRLREAQHINKSLAAISDVLAALQAKDKHIPFRNSKLTHLLQDSLGNDNHTLMLVHVSPTSADVPETINTLQFASRVSHVQAENGRRNDRSEIARLHGVITTQATQLQALQEKLTAELELRKKYEKRMQDYRHEECKRKLKEEELKKQQEQFTSSIVLSPSDQPANGRRWSLYSRGDRRLSLTRSAQNARGLHGAENIAENVLNSQSSVVSSAEESSPDGSMGISKVKRSSSILVRRRSSMENNDKPHLSVSATTGKRKSLTPTEMPRALKKHRMETQSQDDAGSQIKQVSFDPTPVVYAHDTQGATRSNAESPLFIPTPLGAPQRQPTSILRTPSNAFRVTGASRVRASGSIAMTPTANRIVASTPKPKWNGGWR